MTRITHYLTLRQELEYNMNDTFGAASVKAPSKPVFSRVNLPATSRYKDVVMDGIHATTGEQVDTTGLSLDEAWLYVENMGDSALDIGELGIWDGDPAGAGNEIGVVDPGERWGPIKLGANWSAIWLRGDSVNSGVPTARVVIIEG